MHIEDVTKAVADFFNPLPTIVRQEFFTAFIYAAINDFDLYLPEEDELLDEEDEDEDEDDGQLELDLDPEA